MPTMALDDDACETGDTPGGRLCLWLATGLGVGLVAPAPGTVGGLWGLALVTALEGLSFGARVAVVLLLVVIAALICEIAVRELGTSRDPGPIVLDEIVALPIVFAGFAAIGWKLLVAGYVLFRVFDILKIGLASSAERLRGGWGVVADDCVAALQACLALHGIAWLDRNVGYHWLV
jgi:phosphatidylglycerophosphatase A